MSVAGLEGLWIFTQGIVPSVGAISGGHKPLTVIFFMSYLL